MYDKRPQRVDVTKMDELGPSPSKQSRNDSKKEEAKSGTSDHVVALTQLREQIANLQRQLAQKDKDIFAKDRQVIYILNIMLKE